ncbi:MAG: hypothetical protein UX08_C0024G0002 [Candidatus Collierbacteria bacterium GW2011_GWB1_45_35]|uniref:Uncharacterized protein n=2 Tax=Candidatus Collieribacteriota TaxID=1752725 RepID=A0A0G1KQK1_9BACT|nr:MAG: hypothetical protein UW48_C0021G0002 [Microgenomates group bacterium GW2011_GWC1_44_23]KKT85833.1 MAG: hypothetical protein UW84_C0021G0002 [Candidatus Collierbacteria bacterium GW2011_GWA2_44_99]KKT94620.1 MAG: hypothetical protein UW96_C0018G0007 [Candidatus Collierbacteria bacterium GW2011_GWA1_45_15]KKT99405.1 MAG: hypothetical protein UX01_C0010G0037 [Candidatus Collierbacteria bacterium GW2011_GWB2_45_17]KKU04501.1 MAG: hypothetical protein UX08_C0024G0002 [Candidatus Collierbacte
MKKKLALFSIAAMVSLVVACVFAPRAEASQGHPIYVWNDNQTVLLDVRYKMSVGYTYAEIEAAFYAFATQACGGEGEAKCWHGAHVGILKNIISTPKVVAGFYQAPDGNYYLVDVGQCLVKDGCQP